MACHSQHGEYSKKLGERPTAMDDRLWARRRILRTRKYLRLIIAEGVADMCSTERERERERERAAERSTKVVPQGLQNCGVKCRCFHSCPLPTSSATTANVQFFPAINLCATAVYFSSGGMDKAEGRRGGEGRGAGRAQSPLHTLNQWSTTTQ